jgi:hypothetical protein
MRDEIDAARSKQKIEINKKYQEEVLQQIEEDTLKREKASAIVIFIHFALGNNQAFAWCQMDIICMLS